MNALEYCLELAGNGFCVEEAGDVTDYGYWYGMLTFGANAHCDCPALRGRVGAILSEDSQGFKNVELYESQVQLDTAWYDIEKETAAYYGESEVEL